MAHCPPGPRPLNVILTMGLMRSLLKDTAIYGLSSIIGRFLNWCLVPMYTIMFPVAQYGVVTYVYSVVALALIVLTYGLETGFFRFANHRDYPDEMRVYSTGLISLAVTGTAFIALVMCFLGPVSRAMECSGHEEFVAIMAVCVALDAFTALPFSYLRFRKKAARFAALRLVGIGLNIGLNIFFILLCPWLVKHHPGWVSGFYDPDFGIGYIFLSNLVASAVTLLLVVPELRGFRWRFDPRLWRRMIAYSAPLLVLGVAGVMNQTVDKILYPYLVPDHAQAMQGLGIYGANYKIAIVMVMFIQAFRFAYEPFIFAQTKSSGQNPTQAYARAMKVFIIFALAIFLGVMYYLDIIKYFIAPRYFAGLKVVPVIMAAELMFGIFFNLSVWYKVTDRTAWGMYFSLIGLAITVALNTLLVPRMGYMGCALAALGCYGAMMLMSYFVGQRKYPIAYPMKHVALYTLLAIAFYLGGVYGLEALQPTALRLGLRTLLLAAFVAIVAKNEHLDLRTLIPHRK